ncbi:MAG: hypothetical protein JSW06_05460 [Thermoplasmatales archaeon]|nr:MAG: hypothetical protein JSW06_05460 [Thermoplasmatales archaeon]
MERNNLIKKTLTVVVILIFISVSVFPSTGTLLLDKLPWVTPRDYITYVDDDRFVNRLFLKEQIDILHPKAYNFHRSNKLNGLVFSPEDIELKDDAFQGSNTFHFVEWWYFDAMLNEGYSLHVSIHVIGVMERYFVVVYLDIYKNGVPEVKEKKIYFMDELNISTDVPLIAIDGKQVMKGFIDQATGKWIYNVSLEIGESLVDLQFIGCVKGWKGRISIGGWAVILPKAEVSGKIRVNGMDVNVVGIGYHDHNWEITLKAYMNFGWYWGRIISNNLTITWFLIMNTRISGQLLLVINKGKEYYINIEPDNIHFKPGDFDIKNGRFIPHNFVIMADAQNVSLLAVLTSIGTDHGTSSLIRHYCRYHVKSQGSITVDSQVETINGIQIAESMRFR